MSKEEIVNYIFNRLEDKQISQPYKHSLQRVADDIIIHFWEDLIDTD